MNKMAEGLKRKVSCDFRGDPVVKTSPSNAGGAGSSPGSGAETHMPRGQKNKTENRNSIVTNSIKTFKMVHIKKKIFFLFKGNFLGLLVRPRLVDWLKVRV